MAARRIAVLGGTGFVGSAVLRRLADRPATVVSTVRAPRCRTGHRRTATLLSQAVATADLVMAFADVDVVVNAAGCADAASTDADMLVGANALMPLIVRRSAEMAGVRRLVHISSAAVQGACGMLDETERHAPFSPYSLSKCLGERVLLASASGMEIVVYRPTSVHGVDRAISRRIAAVARSRMCSVAGRGASPTPQALLDNVAEAVCHLGEVADPPAIVLHPWEGTTASTFLGALGGRRPRRVPWPLAKLAVRVARTVAGRSSGLAANVRRVELMWFGQAQAESWLTRQGWSIPIGLHGWSELAEQLRNTSADPGPRSRVSGTGRENSD
ncbi:MAG: NAD-dependent epimerase/dehydratase family protein [Dactylosporangium sp.]|nr:NAD-dependent epimerase/dehydratase family protein [Dactylosporangium sp.]NNJ60662.1 NAD-dependent epimerase/dehydratase family protein [Dactylosporangium sp.]